MTACSRKPMITSRVACFAQVANIMKCLPLPIGIRGIIVRFDLCEPLFNLSTTFFWQRLVFIVHIFKNDFTDDWIMSAFQKKRTISNASFRKLTTNIHRFLCHLYNGKNGIFFISESMQWLIKCDLYVCLAS